MKLNEIVIATGNEGKSKEFASLLKGVCERVSPCENFSSAAPEETGATYQENCLIKARAALKSVCVREGRAVLADDSGLEVYALQGSPGVFSARYAGENSTDADNVDKLMFELRGVKDRRARFVCFLTLVLPDGKVVTATGVCEGEITEERKGSGGFGYDPVFSLPSFGATMAQISPEEKNRISHRAKAVKEIAARLLEI